jgi:hypothetical protein
LVLLLAQGVLEYTRFFCGGFGNGDRDTVHVTVDVQGFGGGATA